MPKDNLSPSQPHIPRRRFIKTTGTCGLAGALGIPGFHIAATRNAGAQSQPFPERPNILMVITDQQRYPRHWPEGWAAQNLPNWHSLTQNGITFRRAYCNSSMCSPSRATLMTGLHPAHHGVTDTLTESTEFEYNHLPLDMQNIAHLLGSAGYNIQYRGKWHLSRGDDQFDPSPEDLQAYGFNAWNPPDAGQDGAPENYGSRHDTRFTNEAIQFLNTQTAQSTSDHPFALIVSLVNPHDIMGYPKQYADDYPDITSLDLGIELPGTLEEDLSTKPAVQQALLRSTDLFLGRLLTPQQKLTYVNFYAYLQKKVDAELGRLLDTVRQRGLMDNTVIVHLSDHGEMGLSHGGMRQKAFVVYEEALNVPIVFSNPVLFPEPVATSSLASLIDIMPTLASIANVPDPSRWTFRGQDLTPIFSDPSAEVQDAILFTFDDQRAGSEVASDPMPQPNHIQAIIQNDWKYARYHDPDDPANVELEMYDLRNDPTERNNLTGWSSYAEKEAELQEALDRAVTERLAPVEAPAGVENWTAF